jgi:hypothetical protein
MQSHFLHQYNIGLFKAKAYEVGISSMIKGEERKKNSNLTLSSVGSRTVISCPLAGLLKLKPSNSGIKAG